MPAEEQLWLGAPGNPLVHPPLLRPELVENEQGKRHEVHNEKVDVHRSKAKKIKQSHEAGRG